MLAWPSEPRVDWDDLDFLIAEVVHQRDCTRLAHRVMRRLEVNRSSNWNRFVRGFSNRFCDPFVAPAVAAVPTEEEDQQ